MIINRMPDAEARHHEENVLGMMLLDKRQIAAAILQVPIGAFRFRENIVLYGAIMAIHKRGADVNLVTLGNYLTARNELALVGGTERIQSLMSKIIEKATAQRNAKGMMHGTPRGRIL